MTNPTGGRRSVVAAGWGPDRWDLPWHWNAGAAFARSAGYGAWAGMALGAGLAATTAPPAGAVFGALFGLFVGPCFGMFGGLVLVCASGVLLRRSAWWVSVTAATASMTAAAISVPLLGFNLIAGVWPLLIGSAIVGAACGPRVFWGKTDLQRRPYRSTGPDPAP